MTWRVELGDCVERMAAMPAASVDAIVTDPPYHLSFMGRAWDHAPTPVESQAQHRRWAIEALRVLKPGGHLLAFGGTRTYHRLACAIEDAGFEIRDSINWQHMEPVFCRCDSLPYSHAGDSHVRGVRDADHEGAGPLPGQGPADVFSEVQRGAQGGGVGDARPQGSGGMDGREQGELHGEDGRRPEPGVEGRRDVLAEVGELPADQVRPSAGVGASDGAEGRLRHGAPASAGANDRPDPDANGVRPPSGPRSAEQRDDEPRAMAVEWIPQGGGAWPGCPGCGKPLAPPFFGGPLAWNFGSGFPKSLDVSKAIDKAAGAEREATGPRIFADGTSTRAAAGVSSDKYGEFTGGGLATAPATPDAERWDGWGTALKPAHEPVVCARKPLAGTVASNVLAHGTGALNIDATRIGHDRKSAEWVEKWSGHGGHPSTGGWGTIQSTFGGSPAGRWPANVALDPEAAAILDGATLHLAGNKGGTPRDLRNYSAGVRGETNRIDAMPASPRDEATGASRFMYVAKASSAERNAGLDGFEERGTTADGYGSIQTPKLDRAAPRENWTPHPVKNSHPTVKPVQLMRWLCRLVTPPGGLILDPFTGSGTTGAAAVLEGFQFVGIEREQEYARIAEARIGWWADHPEGVELIARLEAERERKAVADGGQGSIFDAFGEAA